MSGILLVSYLFSKLYYFEREIQLSSVLLLLEREEGGKL
jgi:hypothetical protein